MASLTKKLKRIRKNKLVKSGRRRKRIARREGSTPAFPIHVKGATTRKAAPKRKPAAGSATVARIALKTMSRGGKSSVKEKGVAPSDPRAK